MKPKLSPEQQSVLRGFSIFILIWCIFCIICVLLSSCKSVQTQTQIVYHDSTRIHTIIDTAHITITDTIHVEASKESESESETEIQFGAGGGTWNAQTGEATNVIIVKQSTKEKELQQYIKSQATVIDSQSVIIDSLCEANRDLQETIVEQQNTKEITPRSGWDRFTTWWTIGSWILILLAVAWWLFKKFYLRR